MHPPSPHSYHHGRISHTRAQFSTTHDTLARMLKSSEKCSTLNQHNQIHCITTNTLFAKFKPISKEQVVTLFPSKPHEIRQ